MTHPYDRTWLSGSTSTTNVVTRPYSFSRPSRSAPTTMTTHPSPRPTQVLNEPTLENREYEYLAFGGVYQPGTNVTVEQRYTYTGREKNPASELMYYRYRQYDPRVGRFGARDPIGHEGGPGLYLYAKADPVSLIDPFGLYQLSIDTDPVDVGKCGKFSQKKRYHVAPDPFENIDAGGYVTQYTTISFLVYDCANKLIGTYVDAYSEVLRVPAGSSESSHDTFEQNNEYPCTWGTLLWESTGYFTAGERASQDAQLASYGYAPYGVSAAGPLLSARKPTGSLPSQSNSAQHVVSGQWNCCPEYYLTEIGQASCSPEAMAELPSGDIPLDLPLVPTL